MSTTGREGGSGAEVVTQGASVKGDISSMRKSYIIAVLTMMMSINIQDIHAEPLPQEVA
jgi:hypothetical protein